MKLKEFGGRNCLLNGGTTTIFTWGDWGKIGKCQDIINSYIFTIVTSHLIGLLAGFSETVVTLSYSIWRIPVLSCKFSFGL